MRKIIISAIRAFSVLASLGMAFVFPLENAVPQEEKETIPLENLSVRFFIKDSHFNIVKEGAFGKIEYNRNTFSFQGLRLIPENFYELVNMGGKYEILCLGTAKSDMRGTLEIKGSFPKNLLYDTRNFPGNGGAKIRLVPFDDADCKSGKIKNWKPENWLSEETGLVFKN